MMRKIIFVLVLITPSIYSSILSAAEESIGTECSNAGGKLIVKLTKVDSGFPIQYKYKVTNLTDKNLYQIVVGENDNLTLNNIPNNLQSLNIGNTFANWDATLTRGVEYRFIRIIWRSNNENYDLKPNYSIEGLSIIVGEPAKNIEKLIGADGSRIVPYEFIYQPVSAYYGQGSCIWTMPIQ